MKELLPREHGTRGLQPILEEDEESPKSPQQPGSSRLRHLAHNSLCRTAAKNLALICTWCAVSLCSHIKFVISFLDSFDMEILNVKQPGAAVSLKVVHAAGISSARC
jgi:hypothetical protein